MSLFKANVPPSRVPTLTEVVEVTDDHAGTTPPDSVVAVDAVVPTPADPTTRAVQASAPAPLDAELLSQQVLSDVQRQIDAMLEVRLKEALAPVVARLTDTLARDARSELTKVMKDVVSRAVANELRRTQSKS
jgi:hypothetical protein